MGTDKRTRQKELHRTRLDQARKEAAKSARRRSILTKVSVVIILAVVLGEIAWITGDDDDEVSTADASTTLPATTVVDGASTTVPAAAIVGPGPGE